MKVHFFRPWHLGLVLLAAASAMALMKARAQSAPPVPEEPPPQVTAPAHPVVPGPALAPPPITVSPQAAPSATPATASRSAPKSPVAEPLRTASTTPISNIPAGAYYIQKMRTIILPEVHLKGASLEEAIELLRTISRELDPYEKNPAKKGVNVILKPGTAASKPINLDLKDVPMSEALKYITELAGWKYMIEPFAVVVMPLSEWNTEMYTRTFKVPPDFLTANSDGTGQTATDILKAQGVLFPEGASATFVPATSRLIVRNTQQELDRVEALVEEIQSTTSAIPVVPPPTIATTPQTPTLQVVPSATPGETLQIAAPGSVAKPLQTASSGRFGIPTSAGAYYTEKMRRIMFPHLQLKGASLEEAIEFLRIKSRDYDTYERDPAKKGVNVIIKPNEAASKAQISLDLKEVPMAEALKYVTELAGMRYKIEPYAVVVVPSSEWNAEIYIRTYGVPPDFVTANASEPGQTATDILKAQGVLFPEGASATFVPATSRLIVKNTTPELDRVEVVLEELFKVAHLNPPAVPTGQRVNQATILPQPGVMQPPSPTPYTEMPTQVLKVYGGTVREVPLGGNLFFVEDSSASPSRDPNTSGGAKQLLRDTELRVLMRQFETTVTEIADGEKALDGEGDPAKRAALEAKLSALRRWKKKLEGDIGQLGGTALTPAAGVKTGKVTPISDFIVTDAPYAPVKATGPADARADGQDSVNAWCPASSNSQSDWLQLSFEKEVEVAEIRIYETNATGALARAAVVLQTKDHRILQEYKLWEDTEPREQTPFVRVITAPPGVKANCVRLDLATARIQGWQEIDAVMLVGRDGSQQWAKHATASSSWVEGGKVPVLGDIPMLGRLFESKLGSRLPSSRAQASDAEAPISQQNKAAEAGAALPNQFGSISETPVFTETPSAADQDRIAKEAAAAEEARRMMRRKQAEEAQAKEQQFKEYHRGFGAPGGFPGSAAPPRR